MNKKPAILIGLLIIALLAMPITRSLVNLYRTSVKPYALCTITSIEPNWNYAGVTRIEMEIRYYNVNRYSHYKVGEDGVSSNAKSVSGTGEFGKLFHKTLTLFSTDWHCYNGFYELSNLSFTDWRNPTSLLEVGKTYKITPESPLLIAREIRKDGVLDYHWLSVFNDQDEPDALKLAEQAKLGHSAYAEAEIRYWPTHVAYDQESNQIRSQFAWIGSKPEINVVARQLNPQFCWVEDSKIISKPIQIDFSGALSDGTQTGDLIISLPEIPETAPEDVWLRMTLSMGSDAHRPVEIPVRRRTFYGEDEYPLGTRMVWRSTRPQTDWPQWDMHDFLINQRQGNIIAYGENIYSLDPLTGARTELWVAPSDCYNCIISPDGKYLALLVNGLNVLDLTTGKIIATEEINGNQNLTCIAPSETFSYQVIFDREMQQLFFYPPDTDYQSPPPQIDGISMRREDIYGHILLPNQHLYLTLHKNGTIYAYDTATGEPLWQTIQERRQYQPIMQLSPDGKSVWLNTSTGWEQWLMDTGEKGDSININIPFIENITGSIDHPESKMSAPCNWVWTENGKIIAAEIAGLTAYESGIYIINRENSFTAEQRIMNSFRDPDGHGIVGLIPPIGFIGDNLLIVKRIIRPELAEGEKELIELICIDLREVPKI